ncbi:MAG: hypothetical protein J6B87_06195 [Clostridia bacterium]|nr:hypothetical protein [Clostridia bacterium]
MATPGWNPRIYSIDPVVTQSSVYFNIYVICDINEAYRIDFYVYDSNGNQIQSVWASWKANTHGKFGPYTSDTLTGFSPFTVLSYKVVYSYRDTGTVIATSSGTTATKINEFDWDRAKVKGQEIYITANEWNRLLDTCALEIKYVGNGSLIPDYVIGASTSDNPSKISAQAYNYVVDIFASRLGYTSGLDYVVSWKTPISATLINALKTAINQTIRRYDYGEQPEPDEI